jgi:hypothetical protein
VKDGQSPASAIRIPVRLEVQPVIVFASDEILRVNETKILPRSHRLRKLLSLLLLSHRLYAPKLRGGVRKSPSRRECR